MRTSDLAVRCDSTMSNLEYLLFLGKLSASKSSKYPSSSAHLKELLQASPRLSTSRLPFTYVKYDFRQRVNRKNISWMNHAVFLSSVLVKFLPFTPASLNALSRRLKISHTSQIRSAKWNPLHLNSLNCLQFRSRMSGQPIH